MQNKVVPEDDKTQSPDQVSGYHDDDVGIVLTMLYQYHLVKQIPRQIRCVIPYFIKTVDPSHSYKQSADLRVVILKGPYRKRFVVNANSAKRKSQNKRWSFENHIAKCKTEKHTTASQPFPNTSGGFKLASLKGQKKTITESAVKHSRGGGGYKKRFT